MLPVITVMIELLTFFKRNTTKMNVYEYQQNVQMKAVMKSSHEMRFVFD